MVRTKVFVGNLSFKTTEAELAVEFKSVAPIVSANIISRGTRSLGYGFVELDNEEDATKVVKALNKKEIDGRPINVELARPREEGEENAAEGASPRGGRGRRGRGFGRRRGGSRGGFRGGFASGSSPAPSGEEGTGAPAFRGRRGRGGRRGGGRGRRNSRPPIDERNTVPSTTSVFVANLPFKLDDAAFAELFTKSGIKVKTANVVRKPNGQSKGFGFVDFETEGDQKKAMGLEKLEADGRLLVIRIALNEIPTETKEEEEPKKEAPKKEEVKKEAPKKEEPKKEAPKKEEAKKEAPKKEEAKEEPKKEAPKKEAPKKEAPKEEAKKEAPKKETPKKEAPKK